MSNSALHGAPDNVLAERAAEGDVRAFEVLVRRHSPLMRAYAARLLGSASDADDVVQDAFITAWRRLGNLEDTAAVKPWLMRIASRKSLDHIRARHNDSELSEWQDRTPTSDSPEYRAEVHSQLDALTSSLDVLPPLQRQCWILKVVGGYSYQEIAGELGVAPATVRGALARARRSLLQRMEAWR